MLQSHLLPSRIWFQNLLLPFSRISPQIFSAAKSDLISSAAESDLGSDLSVSLSDLVSESSVAKSDLASDFLAVKSDLISSSAVESYPGR